MGESYKPPASAVKAAKKGLAQRKEWGRGGLSPSEAKSQGIDSGVTRARKIASGSVSRHDVRRMSAFNRHRKNNRPDKKMPDGGPTAGTIAWNLWGGTSGVNWAKKKSAAMNAESESVMAFRYMPEDAYHRALEKGYMEPHGHHKATLATLDPTPTQYQTTGFYDDGNPLSDIYQIDLTGLRYRHHQVAGSQGEVILIEGNIPVDQIQPISYSWSNDLSAEESTLDYNSFTNDMEDLLFKYSQMVMHYDTEYQSKARGGDGVMKMSVSFIPFDAYFDDVDFDAEEGQLAKALAAVREKSKRYAPTPLRLTKLPAP